MAEANRANIEQALSLLREGLASFVSARVHNAVQQRHMDMNLLKRFVEDPLLKNRPLLEWDVSALLRLMRAAWNDLFADLGRATRNLLFETSEIRNAWAHQENFTDEDAMRALDTIYRLLGAIDAPRAMAMTRPRAGMRAVASDLSSPETTSSVSSASQQGKAIAAPAVRVARRPTKQIFADLIRQRLADAAAAGRTSVDLNSGELHRDVGGYPSKSHNMAGCCDAMNDAARAGDRIISSPPKGKGASLTIRYVLPR